jgi:hypothetical protein
LIGIKSEASRTAAMRALALTLHITQRDLEIRPRAVLEQGRARHQLGGR